MPNVTVTPNWSLHVDTAELRLVLKALGGRLRPEDLEAANELCDKLTLARSDSTKSMLAQAEQTIASVTRKSNSKAGVAQTVADLDL